MSLTFINETTGKVWSPSSPWPHVAGEAVPERTQKKSSGDGCQPLVDFPVEDHSDVILDWQILNTNIRAI